MRMYTYDKVDLNQAASLEAANKKANIVGENDQLIYRSLILRC